MLPGILVIGLGLGFTFVPLTLIGTTTSTADDAGLASGLFNTSQQIGGALGLAILSTIAANRTAERLTGLGHERERARARPRRSSSGFHVGFLAGAGLMALGVVARRGPRAGTPRRRRSPQRNRRSPPGRSRRRAVGPVPAARRAVQGAAET